MSLSNISVVILNWNGRDFLEKFLPSVTQYSGDAKIVVADNASTDDSIDFIKKNYPNIDIILNSENGGFAKGYNDALKKVDSDIYMLLNSDIEVTPNWLEPMALMMKDKSIAGCQPKVLSYHDKTKFEHAGASGGYIDKNYFPFCRGRFFDSVEDDHGQYDTPQEVFWATGASLMIRARDYHNAGGFDDDFFAHMEEIDLCWRLKNQNKKFMVVPSSVVYHVGGGTLPYNSSRKVYLNFRNSLIMITKNHHGKIVPKILYRLCIDGAAGMKFLLNGEFKNFAAVFKAHIWHHSHFRSMIKKRRETQARTTFFNSKGWYTGSIILDYFFKKNKEYSKLDQDLFK
ncbi:MAG: glycosyltransferase family 2 protein [Crocinitomicaceae bacterium]|nr:glycosyltransferase family 2 protein [Crocinitomicaceae bacterium]